VTDALKITGVIGGDFGFVSRKVNFGNIKLQKLWN